METIQLEGTDRTPKILFDFGLNHFSLTGMSYPEDVSALYGDLVSRLTAHLDGLQNADVCFDFCLIYFNSSTAKVVMRLFEALEQTAQNGNRVVVNWYHEEDDDNMREMGEEFSEDLQTAQFNLLAK